MSCIRPAFFVLLALPLLAGCAWLPGARQRKVAAAEKQLVASRRAPTPVGRVELVNEEERFALIETGGAQPPNAGTELRVYRNGAVVAEMRATGVRRRPFVVADLMTGEPARGDVVLRAGVLEEAPRAEAAAPVTPEKRSWWQRWSGLIRRGK